MLTDAGSQALQARLFEPGPKRILSLDGGGVRGILSAGILREIEQILKRRSGKADFRLCDYFDLIGGTSTGSIIAAALAMGRSADEVAQLYRELAPRVFAKGGEAAGIRRPRFDAERLDEVLARELGEYELGSPALRTGFAVFTKRIDTGSQWTLTNNPHSAFWDTAPGRFANRRLQIRKLVLASAAAPSFFESRRIRVAPEGEALPPGVHAEGEFVDGGVAALNDPSLQLLKVATLAPFGFNWTPGDDRLLMISVGTGYWRPALDTSALDRDLLGAVAPVAAQAVFALKSMIHDASLGTLTTMQSLSEPAKPWRIDSELGEMKGARVSPVPVLHFQRFDARLDDAAEMARLGLNYAPEDIEAMKELASDDPATLARLYEIGRKAGEDYFRRGPGEPSWENLIFPPRFDPNWFKGPPPGPARNRLQAMGRVFAKR